ncbi:MAG: GspE/PulE family protein [Phycisphaerales bacterium JB063]
MKLRAPQKRLGELLIDAGLLTDEQLAEALKIQKRAGAMLGSVLIEEGMVTGAALVNVLAEQLGIRGVTLRPGLIDTTLLKEIGQEEAMRLKAVPMFRVRETMTVAMAQPQSLPTIDRLRSLTGCKIRPVLALPQNIENFIERNAGENLDVDDFLAKLNQSNEIEVIEREDTNDDAAANLDRLIEGSPIVNLVNIALLQAVKDGASDIHIEPERKGTRIRYRIDGSMRELMKPPSGMHAAIVSRVKVVGKMDISEKRLPQEGRVRIVAEGRDVDLRVSSIPTLLGEKLVIRLLDKSNLNVRMEQLGFRAEALGTFKHMLAQPNGLVLVTGPTGSGKTTTLYSALDLLRSPEVNLVTVEDPVEYQMDLINQIHVNDAVGMTFARALRSILRQDPDIIMVGEIRDEETARVAVQAALTGHLVLATLHTNDAPGAVSRLLDMGIEPYLLSGALVGVVAQRLARKVCTDCQTKYYPDPEILEEAGLLDKTGRAFRKGAGCRACHDTGFRGRVGVYEVMEVTSPIRRLIHRAAASHELRDTARAGGATTLHEEGIALALAGATSLEEIIRVTRSEDVGEPLPPQPADTAAESPRAKTKRRRDAA